MWLDGIYKEKDNIPPDEFEGNTPCILSSYESIDARKKQLVNIVFFKKRQNWELVDIYIGGEIGGGLGKHMELWEPVVLKIDIRSPGYSEISVKIRIDYIKDNGQGSEIIIGQGPKVEILEISND